MLEFAAKYHKRIRLEMRRSNEAGNEYNLRQIDDNDMMQLLMTIKSPEDSLYLGLKIECLVNVPSEYPFKAPKFRFLTPIKHMLVSPTTGSPCISILDRDVWSPATTLVMIAKHVEEHLFQTPTRDQVDQASCYTIDPELLDMARGSLDQYSAVVKHHSQAIINKNVAVRSIW